MQGPRDFFHQESGEHHQIRTSAGQCTYKTIQRIAGVSSTARYRSAGGAGGMMHAARSKSEPFDIDSIKPVLTRTQPR
jgi:hypothetical protein